MYIVTQIQCIPHEPTTNYWNSYSPSLDVPYCKYLNHNTEESAEDFPLFVHLLNTAEKKQDMSILREF